jgi:hypothetical protein
MINLKTKHNKMDRIYKVIDNLIIQYNHIILLRFQIKFKEIILM